MNSMNYEKGGLIYLSNHPNCRCIVQLVNTHEDEYVANEYTARKLLSGVECGELIGSKDKNLFNIQSILAEVESK